MSSCWWLASWVGGGTQVFFVSCLFLTAKKSPAHPKSKEEALESWRNYSYTKRRHPWSEDEQMPNKSGLALAYWGNTHGIHWVRSLKNNSSLPKKGGWKIIRLFGHVSDLALKSNDEVLHQISWTRWSRYMRPNQLDEVFFIHMIQNHYLSGAPQFFPILWLAGQKFFCATSFKGPIVRIAMFCSGPTIARHKVVKGKVRSLNSHPFSSSSLPAKKYHSRGLGGWVGADIRRGFPSYFPRKLTVRPSKMMIKLLLSF